MKNFKFKEFFDSTPTVIDVAIALSVFTLGMGFAVAIALSKKVNIGRNWVEIERQAIVTHKDLEQALTMIKIQDGVIDRQKVETEKFSRNCKTGGELLEQAEFAAEVISDEQIQELEAKVGESKLRLDKALPN